MTTGYGRLLPVPSSWAPLIADFCTWMIAVGRTPATIELRDTQLRFVARDLGGDPADVTEGDLLRWFSLYPSWGRETRRSYRAGVYGFFGWAHEEGRIPENPAADLPKMPNATPAPRPADENSWRAALSAADVRTTLMLRLAGEAGLRRGEVAQIHTRDLIDSTCGPQLLVHGKGAKKRVVPLSDSLAALIRQGAHGHTPGAPTTGWLFPGGGPDGHMSARWVGKIVSDALPQGVTMHMLRHRFATRAYRGSRNLRAVQQLLGHASVATTERYTAVNDDEMRAAMMAAAGG